MYCVLLWRSYRSRFSQKSAKLFCQFIQLLNAYDFGLNKLLKETSEKRLFLHKSQTFALVILKEKLSELRENVVQYRICKQELKKDDLMLQLNDLVKTHLNNQNGIFEIYDKLESSL